MAKLVVRPLEQSDLPACGALLAARHTRDSQRLPAMNEALRSPQFAAVAVKKEAFGPRVDAVVAVRDGEVVGFLAGQRMLLPPDFYVSLYVEHHSAQIGTLGHAVAAGIDTTDVYRRMYAVLSGEWVRAGFFAHAISLPAGDGEVQEAWVSLGFGRKTTAAVRPTGPVETTSARSLEVHRASAEDIDVVVSLERTLARHHASPPIFWPDLRETDDSFRQHQLQLIADPASAFFLAYEGGRAMGMQTFVEPGYTPATVAPDLTVYLYEGVVEPDARGGGLGTALLSHSMAWAREQGYANCCLHFASDNPSGAPYWFGQGFVPVEHTMVRRIDERIAWAGVV